MSKSLELVQWERMGELDAREDSFGNEIRLLWDPTDNSVHLSIDNALDITVPAAEAKDSFDHPYALLAFRLGEAAVDAATLPAVQAA